MIFGWLMRAACFAAHDKGRERPAQKIECTIEQRIVAMKFDFQTPMRDRRAIAAEHGADVRQRHPARNMREVHGDLTRECDITHAARACPQHTRLNAEDARHREVKSKARLPVAVRFGGDGKCRSSGSRLQCQVTRDLQHVSSP